MRLSSFILCFVMCLPALASVMQGGAAPTYLGADIEAHGPLSLDGDWLYYPGQLLGPNSVSIAEPRPGFLFQPVPAAWKSPRGHGTYFLSLPFLDSDETYALRIGHIGSAYRLWANGVLIANVGSVSDTATNHTPRLDRQVVELPRDERINLTLQVSNYSLPEGGIIEPVVLGRASELKSAEIRFQLFKQFLIGALMIFGLYSLANHLVAGAGLSNLYFGIFNIAIASRIFLLGESEYLSLGIPWHIRFSLEEITYYIALPAFVMFSRSMYPDYISGKFERLTIGFSLLYILLVVLTNVEFVYPLLIYYHLFTIWVGLYLLYSMLSQVREGNRESLFVLAGGVAFLVTIANDILAAHKLIDSVELVPFGVLIIIFVYALVMGIRTHRSHQTIEDLSNELRTTNQQLTTYQSDLEEAVKQRTIELESAKLEAEQANQAKDSFLALMSHEIRTPLNAILGIAQLLEKGRLDDKQARNVSMLKSSSTHLLSLINNILEFMKIDHGEYAPVMQPTDIRQTCEEIANIFQHTASEKNLALHVILSEHLPDKVETYQDIILQCLVNLLGNACKFTSEGYVQLGVDIEQSGSEGWLHFRVKDTGSGIASNVQESIFEEFTQVDSSLSRSYEGTGLGLAITQKLLNSINGSIRVQSKLGIGSEFEIRVPFVAVPNSDFRPSAPSTQTTVIPSHDLLPRILVAEDNAVNQLVIEQMFEALGYTLQIASNGLEAVEMYKEMPADLVFMDMHMPVMDGIEATARISAEAGNRPVFIIAMTADAMQGARDRYLSMGMTDYLEKPIELDKLRKVIEHWHRAWLAQTSTG